MNKKIISSEAMLAEEDTLRWRVVWPENDTGIWLDKQYVMYKTLGSCGRLVYVSSVKRCYYRFTQS